MLMILLALPQFFASLIIATGAFALGMVRKIASHKPLLFLSHAGVDTSPARELKAKIEAHPRAKAAGLSVWFDKDELKGGVKWLPAMEEALAKQATAFAVYVGTLGIVNWVEREVHTALVRATGRDAIPFVPILANAKLNPAILPPFAQQHQCIIDPLHDAKQLDHLVDAVLGGKLSEIPAVERPFIGLQAMDERHSGIFFGRDAEIKELAGSLGKHRLLAIVADSGAGKSSLALAGLVPAFRGGVMEEGKVRVPKDTIWHTLTMRPGNDPLRGLRDAVNVAAERRGLDEAAKIALRDSVDFARPDATPYALRVGLPDDKTETLLVVDQFDELLTETPEDKRGPFIDQLMHLVNLKPPGGFYVVLTVRIDYFNLCRPFGNLYERVAAEQDPAQMRLKRISDEGLEEAVLKPLELAGFKNREEAKSLASAMKKDLGDRAGDLALAQAALELTWTEHVKRGGSLVTAYVDLGRVSGALAQEAERVRESLSAAEQNLLLPLLVRLIRLGDTGGALRRIAPRSELDEARRALADKLSNENHGRLLLASEEAYEVCHEQLITQWPWLQNALNASAPDLRLLDRLEDKAPAWVRAEGRAKTRFVATGDELERFALLAAEHGDWLTGDERQFVTASHADEARATRNRRMVRMAAGVGAVLITGFAGVAGWQWREAEIQKAEAIKQKERAEKVLTASGQIASDLVFELARKFKNVQGVPVSVITDILNKSQGLQKLLIESGEEMPESRRMESVVLNEIGDTLMIQGNLRGAEESYAKSLAITEKLSLADPGNAEWQRELSVSYDRIGNVRLAQGNLGGAEQSYAKSLAITEKLSFADPGNAGWQRDLSVIYSRIGDVRLAQGNLGGAEASYAKSLAIAEKLSLADPGNAEWQRDLSFSYEKIGNVRLAQGNLGGAEASYAKGLAIREKLSLADPGNAGWHRDLSVSYAKIGDVRLAQGNLGGAEASYAKSLAITEKLSLADPDNAGWQRDLTLSYNNIGVVRQAQGNLGGAEESYAKSLAIREKLSLADPGNAGWQRDLAVSYWKLAAVGVAVKENYGKALAVLQKLKAEGRLRPVDETYIGELEGILAGLK